MELHVSILKVICLYTQFAVKQRTTMSSSFSTQLNPDSINIGRHITYPVPCTTCGPAMHLSPLAQLVTWPTLSTAIWHFSSASWRSKVTVVRLWSLQQQISWWHKYSGCACAHLVSLEAMFPVCARLWSVTFLRAFCTRETLQLKETVHKVSWNTDNRGSLNEPTIASTITILVLQSMMRPPENIELELTSL